jgi:integrase
MNSHLRLISPTDVNGAVAVDGTNSAVVASGSAAPARKPRRPAATMPRRPRNSELRPREYLTPTEVDQLLDAAKCNRHGHRDATMILIAYRHGLRAAEICDLRWSQVDLDQARLHVRRVKEGTPSVHPLQGDELRALRRLKRESPAHSAFVFVNERKTPFETVGFAFMVSRAGAKAGLPFKCHPHMLRHACGYALINKGADLRSLQSYLGHVSVSHTTRYAQLSAAAFNNFWRG